MAAAMTAPLSSTKTLGRSNSRGSRKRGANVVLILLLGLVVIVVFICGLYVGSTFMQEHNNLDFSSTFEILNDRKNLRGNLPSIPFMDKKKQGPPSVETTNVLEAGEKVPEGVEPPKVGPRPEDISPEVPPEPKVQANIEPPKVIPEAAAPAKEEPARKEAAPKDLVKPAREVPVPPIKSEADHEVPVAKQKEEKRQESSNGVWEKLLEADKKDSFVINNDRHAVLNSPMDELAMTMAAWVYLDRSKESKTMQTILSNKKSGCETTPDRMGYSLYVNTWDTVDHQLIFEWGNEMNGCAKLGSGQSGAILEYDTWTHVAAVLTSSSAALYINGKEVAMSKPITRKNQQQTPLTLGMHADSQYSFFGNISSVAIFREAFEEKDSIKDLMAKPLSDPIYSGSNVMVVLPLNDVTKKAKVLHDLKGEAVGKYSLDFGSALESLEDSPQAVDREVTPEMKAESDALARTRRVQVKGAMQRVWKAYKEHAWGRDELKPQSLQGHDNWGGIGCTLVDSLDTLWLMGMKDEFWEARDWVRDKLSFSHTGTVSVFETTIRELGGLLSAYDLSGDEAFLNKARDLGDRLLAAFDTPSGIPNGQVNLQSKNSHNAGWTGGSAILAELGTMQVEFRYLSQATGDPIYAQKVNKVFDIMAEKHPNDGLYPIYVNTHSGQLQGGAITFGALGDSFYEYMLKVWLQGGRKEDSYRKMFDDAMDGMMKKLLQKSKPSGMLYVADLENGHINHKMDHLVCFLPAVLALGAKTLPHPDPEREARYMSAAKGLTYTCYQMYHKYPTHLAPEYSRFVAGQDMVPGANFYILRPEAAEAIFYMHELTGDPIYREWAWEIFEAIERYCKTEHAYGAHPDVTSTSRRPDDRMESFFLAETMKYLYLIQDPDHPIDLFKYVFNTEAHPMKIFEDVKEIKQPDAADIKK